MKRQKSRTLIRRLSGRLIAATELGHYKFPICDFWNFILSLMLAYIMGVCIYAFHYVLLVNQSALLLVQIMTGIVFYAVLVTSFGYPLLWKLYR